MTDFSAIETAAEDALAVAETVAPSLITALTPFVPGLSALAGFLKFLPLAIQAIQVVQAASGNSVGQAAQAVADHLTPGKPNAPALAPVPANQTKT